MVNMAEHYPPVTPFSISPSCSASELVARMADTSFQARNLARGAEIWGRMLAGEVTIFFGLAGAMVPAGMRQVMVYLIQNRLIDCLVSTGANLVHDVHETLGRRHWQGQATADDEELARRKINRIHDVFLPERELDQTEEFIARFSSGLSPDQAYSTGEYLFLLGKELSSCGEEEGILSAAAKADIPVYCPALADSILGTALACLRVSQGKHLYFDIVKDVVEMIQLVSSAKSSGVIFIGGGTPKNFIQQAALYGYLFGKEPRGHEYAIQITTDSPHWGGLSGCTFEEAHSWNKVAPQALTVTINSDATIALPILVSALAESSAESIKDRRKPVFHLARGVGAL
jgi:deoxyhypusine synthase